MNKNLDIIKEELLNSNISAATIDEEWGIGKTHELLKIKENIKNDNTESKKWKVIYLKIADLKYINYKTLSESTLLHYIFKDPIMINTFLLTKIRFYLTLFKGNVEALDSLNREILKEQNKIINNAKSKKRFIQLEGVWDLDYAELIGTYDIETCDSGDFSFSLSLKRRIYEFPFFFNRYFIEECFLHNRTLLCSYLKEKKEMSLKEFNKLAFSFDEINSFKGFNDKYNSFGGVYNKYKIKHPKIKPLIDITTFNEVYNDIYTNDIILEHVKIKKEEAFNFYEILPIILRFDLGGNDDWFFKLFDLFEINEKEYFRLKSFLKLNFNDFPSKENTEKLCKKYKIDKQPLSFIFSIYQSNLATHYTSFCNKIIAKNDFNKCFKNIST